MELGIGAFGDANYDPATGTRISEAQAIRNVVESIVVAEQAGLDWFGVGEHHTPEFPASSAAPILAAAAAQTTRIKLSSAVTVLGTDDPVRVYEQYSTVDAISHGRVEMIPGRGSSVESFPLFGYDLQDYDRLFAEKLELLLEINRSARVTWSGTTRPALNGEYVPPRPEHGPIPIWLGVGGNPKSAIRAAALGLPLATGVLGGNAVRSAPLADLYRRAAQELGNPPEQTLVMLGSPGFLAKDGRSARETWWPHWHQFMKVVGEQRGFLPPTRASYDRDTGPGGGLLIGSPEEIAERILHMHERWGHVRQYIHIDTGALPQKEVLRAIELFGTEVRPLVQAELGATTVDELMGRRTVGAPRVDR
ncbi:probable oxidoreductase, LLM family [Micromonospora phaseoli]|uniref:Probable oxidoreductase, LLM family n=1 Tax=Micromonospora phaseoli TaxID=1144548 RepID=A0A1H7E0H9_9ACTN|nr:LLM class flavin-dependent oxidoreductase [Micromonospora phaseoli]PZW00531.1 putative LLM family oxidoreductase [Micromonospora phaseoli]GIJ81352.1 luciferase [Micromonospora phaseoli]SEK07174.1 probable oxidoreductase, LLM family [Micromonospora phaseoli]